MCPPPGRSGSARDGTHVEQISASTGYDSAPALALRVQCVSLGALGVYFRAVSELISLVHPPSPAARSPSRALFPPHHAGSIPRLWAPAIGELVRRLLPRRRPRANPRVVKRKYTRWHVKRARHRRWRQPGRRHEQAIAL